MKNAGGSCDLAKQILAISFIVFVVFFTGVTLIRNSSTNVKSEIVGLATYENPALDMQVKLIDESGNVIGDYSNYVANDNQKKEQVLDEKAKEVISNVFSGKFIFNFLEKSNLDKEQKEIIYSIFEEKNNELESENSVALHIDESLIEEDPIEENIIVPNSNVSGEELIEVEQVNVPENEQKQEAIKPGQETVWLYEESQVPSNYITYYDMQATAYCLCKKCTGKTPGSAGYGRTASGLVIKPGTSMKVCAVSRNQIPLGTHIYVQGLNGAKDYGYAIAADTGGAITTNRIDLYFDNHSTCLQWGRRSVRVYILPEE